MKVSKGVEEFVSNGDCVAHYENEIQRLEKELDKACEELERLEKALDKACEELENLSYVK